MRGRRLPRLTRRVMEERSSDYRVATLERVNKVAIRSLAFFTWPLLLAGGFVLGCVLLRLLDWIIP